MVHGFQKPDGKLHRQSIWLAVAGNEEDFPKLLTLQKKCGFKLSPIGKKMDVEDFVLPLKYIAKLDSEYPVRNEMALWKMVCSNGLFDIWDPAAPYKRFAQAESDPAKFRIQLLRIYEIDHEFSKDDIKINDRSDHLIPPIPEVENGTPVIPDDEFGVLRDLLKRSVTPYYPITNKDIELLESEEDEFPEGRLLTRTHKLRERNPQASIQKKKNVLKKTGTLVCEVCGFDFHATYGALGYGFAECHHRVPLSELAESNTTKLEDLAIVCENCHRMLHKARPWKTIEELKKILTHNT
jgi:5-methylcytosine-specific restriction endonuclease McrA